MKRPLPPPPRDSHLWDEIKASVRPLGVRRSSASWPLPHKATRVASGTVPHPAHPSVSAPAVPHRVHVPQAPPPLTGLDRRLERRLGRGKIEIDARLDLHGTGVEEARVRLFDFIRSTRLSGQRTVLVITGKGASPFSGHTLHGLTHFHVPERAGLLRRRVPEWLHEAHFRAMVAGFQPAHPKHGGGGAFYVRLRRLEFGA